MCAICFSLSSASPAHTPKDEYAITQPAFAPKLEPVHDQPEDQGERRDDIPEPTERKSLSGWSAAHRLSQSLKGCVESCVKALPLIFYHVPRDSSFQWSCLSVACVPLLGLRCRRRKRHGRSIRSSWRRRCKKPGGWCFTCRSALGGGISLRTPNKTFEYINQNYSSVLDTDLLRISFSRQDKHTALVSFLHKSVVSLSLAVSLFCSISVRKTRQKAENRLLLSTSKHY